MKNIVLLCLLAIQLVFIIILSSYEKLTVLNDLVSVIFDLTIFLIIAYKARKASPFRIYLALLGGAIFSWLIADGLWLIMNYYELADPNESSLLALIYLIPNLFLTAMTLLFFIINRHKWHSYQLLIDILAVTALVYIFLQTTLSLNTSLPLLTLDNFISVYGYIITNLMMLLIIIAVYASYRNQKMTLGLKLIISGLLLYIAADLYFSYHFIADSYIPYSFVDYLYYFSFILMAAAALYGDNDSLQAPSVGDHKTLANIGKTRVILILGILVFFHTYFNKGTIEFLFLILSTILVHELLSKYMQNSILTTILLDQEQHLTINLEATIKSRTTDLIAANEKLYEQATTDALTGLNNRFYFNNILEKAIKKNEPFSILYMNIDRFKIINDIHGHSMGDRVMIEIAMRLQQLSVRDCIIARIIGDEFGIIYYSADRDAIQETAANVFRLFESDIIIEGFRFNINVSIGASRYPQDALTADGLLKFSSLSMYQAKNSNSKSTISIFDNNLIETATRRNQIEWQLKRINFDQEFYLHYQPQFHAADQSLSGIEALIRWHNPTLGFVSPAEFIPIAEEIGSIVQVTDWVFKEVQIMSQLINLNRETPIRTSINISPMSFDYVDFFPSLIQKIQDHQIDPAIICLEVTEHSAMSTASQMEEVFTTLNGMGFEIAIDDFGTGYSSLSYLKRFDIDQLKIAKELIDNVAIDHQDRLIVKAIILMAQGLGLQTVAEGVETQEQLQILKDLNCDIIQGYVWGRPVSKDDFTALYLFKDNTQN